MRFELAEDGTYKAYFICTDEEYNCVRFYPKDLIWLKTRIDEMIGTVSYHNQLLYGKREAALEQLREPQEEQARILKEEQAAEERKNEFLMHIVLKSTKAQQATIEDICYDAIHSEDTNEREIWINELKRRILKK